MKNLNLKYLGSSITFQEVPDETSLVINISGCPHHCEGCHSEYLWVYEGDYITDDLDNLLNQYKDYITCVCFMGGDQNIDELIMLCKKIKNSDLKVCVYSGRDDIEYFDELIRHIDYLKIGRYIEGLGGLNSKTTNQKFYDLKNNKEIKFYKN